MKTNGISPTVKLEQIAIVYCVSVAELLELRSLEDIVPGICMNEECDFTALYEPDQAEGWCEECRTQSVKSCLVLAHII